MLPENSDPDAHRVDIAGAVLGAAALTALIFAVIDAESAGFGAPSVIVLLCLSALAGAAFFWWESRAAHPLLDLKFLRVPRFLTANVVAFCAYFATFAVFFFTALYLEEVVGDSGYQLALIFLPMTALMILASLLAGRWTDPAAPRWSIFLGCLLFGAGLLLTTLTLNPDPAYLPLAAALALTGIGIGATVVPITSAALSAVPAARSGMAASATNTSREIGAVTGVAVLGALVNSQLHASLTSRLQHLGIPANFQAIVIHAVETGGVPAERQLPGRGRLGRGRARASWSRRSSTRRTTRSTRDCTPRCCSPRSWCWPPGCSRSCCSAGPRRLPASRPPAAGSASPAGGDAVDAGLAHSWPARRRHQPGGGCSLAGLSCCCTRRTSSTCTPRSSSRASRPCRAAWSCSFPWTRVPTGSTVASSFSKSSRASGGRTPTTRIS